MTSKLRNRMKQVLYRPSKKSPAKEFVVGKLSEAEKALNSTVGGMLKKKPIKKKGKEEDKGKK